MTLIKFRKDYLIFIWIKLKSNKKESLLRQAKVVVPYEALEIDKKIY